jgi:hypothetical protein
LLEKQNEFPPQARKTPSAFLIFMSATVPCARERVMIELLVFPFQISKQVFKERTLPLFKEHAPPLAARTLSSSRRPRSTFAPMLDHLGALGRHLGANMSHHSSKMTSKTRSWIQHGSKQCLKRFNTPLQPPQKNKKRIQTNGFSLFLL